MLRLQVHISAVKSRASRSEGSEVQYSEFGVGQKLSIADLRKPRFSSKSKCRNQFFCKPLSDKMIARNALE